MIHYLYAMPPPQEIFSTSYHKGGLTMNYYQRAMELRDETIAHRRFFHTHAEVGLEMPEGQTYVLRVLRDLQIHAQPCGHGVEAVLGTGTPCLLLRADMDALPMPEESGLPFACPTGTEAHGCGHDFHVAMLLTAAKMLKETEPELCGTVKLMFQPGEETFQGAKNMIDHGILDAPVPDGALAFHVAPGKMPPGLWLYNDTDTMMHSVDGFRILVRGKGTHGAYPHAGIDPIHIAAHIYLALEGLIARETDPDGSNVLTIGKFNAGTVANCIPDTAELQGTIRSNDPASRERLVARMAEIAEKTAGLWGGSAEIEMLSQVPPLICDGAMTREMVGYLEELGISGGRGVSGIRASASEDFATIAARIPSAFVYLAAGFPDARGDAPAHNPKVQFHEDICPIGAAAYAHCAAQWLKNHPAP